MRAPDMPRCGGGEAGGCGRGGRPRGDADGVATLGAAKGWADEELAPEALVVVGARFRLRG